MPTLYMIQCQYLPQEEKVSLDMEATVYEELTTTFLAISTSPNDINEDDIAVLKDSQCYYMIVHCTNSLMSIDEARK